MLFYTCFVFPPHLDGVLDGFWPFICIILYIAEFGRCFHLDCVVSFCSSYYKRYIFGFIDGVTLKIFVCTTVGVFIINLVVCRIFKLTTADWVVDFCCLRAHVLIYRLVGALAWFVDYFGLVYISAVPQSSLVPYLSELPLTIWYLLFIVHMVLNGFLFLVFTCLLKLESLCRTVCIALNLLKLVVH